MPSSESGPILFARNEDGAARLQTGEREVVSFQKVVVVAVVVAWASEYRRVTNVPGVVFHEKASSNWIADR